jgi:polar amino acid transport system permease protein
MRIDLDFMTVLSQWPMLVKGVAWTVGLTAVATVLGLAIGILFAWMRAGGPIGRMIGGPRALGWLVGIYVELIRNTPFIVQLLFIFFGLPAAGVKLSPELASVIAMVINLGAYATEIVRAGIEATPRGQIEAAMSLAMGRAQTVLRVVLPPALAKVWPAMVGQIIIVMLGSAVCGQISTQELSFAANLIQSRNFRAFEAFIVATAIYLVLAIALRRLLNWLGARVLLAR